MRQVVLDTETTGLNPNEGHRVIEIGCVEIIDRRVTGKHFHTYLNPERMIERAAFEVHGLSDSFLADKPLFSQIQEQFLEFVKEAELIIHNAPFDVGFLEAELRRIKIKPGKMQHYCQIVDTLVLARKLHPGQKNSLDALCKRYRIDNSHRELHGALLDAQILANVYLVMTGGQSSLFDENEWAVQQEVIQEVAAVSHQRQTLPVISPNEDEQLAHRDYLKRLKESSGVEVEW